ncbi:hypothetical protein [Pleurocapsa sp. FMAR1]|uniref:hypothetical protein n=1 Tax=Pleurocapsa sp. FMAR1 TaxID=3040204 RepID=UPI0029C88B9C|nr:hypothetical protein [Pleurocapsa sp. FMAR1]
MKAWLIGVGILFVLAEFGIWLKQFMLPLPIYILGGAFLAIASNYEKGIMAMFRQQSTTDDALYQTATLINQIGVLEEDRNKTSSLPKVPQDPQSDH